MFFQFCEKFLLKILCNFYIQLELLKLFAVVLANFLSILQLVIPCLLLHTWACSGDRHSSKQADPALRSLMSRRDCLFTEFSVLIGWSGQGYQKKYSLFYCMSRRRRDMGYRPDTPLVWDYCRSMELLNAYFDKDISLTAALKKKKKKVLFCFNALFKYNMRFTRHIHHCGT